MTWSWRSGGSTVWTQRTRVDRHGLWIKPGRILGVTARSLREAIERAPQVHLCRSEECLQESAFHCKAYAAIDADAVIDLGAYRRLNSWRMLVLCCRGARTCRRSTGRYLRCCFSRRSTEAPRQIQDQGVARVLDPDSESEAEVVSDPCEAVLVGLELQGKPRALAPEGCEDRAATEPTRLLDDDLQLSDLGGKECARLCNHHSQLYMLCPARDSDFGTPPCPPVTESVPKESSVEGVPPDVDPVLLLESFRDARSQGSSVSEAITLVAGAFGVSPEVPNLFKRGSPIWRYLA